MQIIIKKKGEAPLAPSSRTKEAAAEACMHYPNGSLLVHLECEKNNNKRSLTRKGTLPLLKILLIASRRSRRRTLGWIFRATRFSDGVFENLTTTQPSVFFYNSRNESLNSAMLRILRLRPFPPTTLDNSIWRDNLGKRENGFWSGINLNFNYIVFNTRSNFSR